MPILAGSPTGYAQLNGWSAVLGSVMVAGGDAEALGFPGDPGYCALPVIKGCLTLPPDGLGLPDLRTQDIAYLGRDGVKHHEDWYEPRIVTLSVSIGPDSTCGCDVNTSLRQAVQDLVNEWRRVCNTERELVIYPPNCVCDDLDNTTTDINRPLGIVGRPRQANVTYTRNGTADITLRFDAEDHLMNLLDCCGTPGSGQRCEVFTPNIDVKCRQYNRCYTACAGSPAVSGWGYDVESSITGGPITFTGGGTECVDAIVTLYGPLTNPIIESVLTGQQVAYVGIIPAGSSVEVDIGLGTATEGGQDRTGKLEGDLLMLVQPGSNEWRLQAFSSTDDGYAQICWRPAVIVA